MLAGLATASVQGRFALGVRAGRPVRRCGGTCEPGEWQPSPDDGHARHEGFDLHAAVRVPAGARDRLEALCRYALRPPVAQDRLTLTAAGHVVLRLGHAWSDGTTHLLFDPVEFLERLAVLVPRPRINLLLYHGVLAPRAGWRAQVVRFGESGASGDVERQGAGGGSDQAQATGRPARREARLWADLMRRSFGIDSLACPRCGGRLALIAVIEEASVIGRILRHLGLPTALPTPSPSRAPPLFDGCAIDEDLPCRDAHPCC